MIVIITVKRLTLINDVIYVEALWSCTKQFDSFALQPYNG